MTTYIKKFFLLPYYMVQEIEDAAQYLRECGAPREHHLVGRLEILAKPDLYRFTGTAYFSSDIPSVGDRKDHVNVANSLFATWNAVHIGASEYGFEDTRASEAPPGFRVRGIIPPDTKLGLEVSLKKLRKMGGRDWFDYESRFSLEGKTLLVLQGRGSAKKISW